MTANLDRMWSLIRQLQGAIDGKSTKSGTVVCTFPGGSQTTTGVAVAHGFDSAPLGVSVSVNGSSGVRCWARTSAPGATTFTVVAETSDAAPAGGTTVTVFWEAVQ